MRSFLFRTLLAPLFAGLLLSGCSQNPLAAGTTASSAALGDVVPDIQYPDVYLASQGFGFNLPQGWSGAWHEGQQIIQFTRSPFLLTLYYDSPHASARTIMAGTGTHAGTLEIQGFWNSTLMDKFRLAGPFEGSDLIAYFAREPLNGVWLTAYLECTGESCDGGIMTDIVAQVDELLASYEEHGWEE